MSEVAPPDGQVFSHAITYGTNYSSEGTRFHLWAPAAQQVELILEERVLPMLRDERGCHAVTVDAAPEVAYAYRIDGGAQIPDPASRCQQADAHGPSVLIDPAAFCWRSGWVGRPWHEAVICEVHAGCLGGFDGLRKRLPEFIAAGYTAIELMPIAQFSGTRNWGYDGTLLFAPHNAYGTPDSLKRLVDEAHGLGLMVFLDVVYNHFGPDGNYLPAYAPQFFRDGTETPWGPAIDFEREEVRQFYLDNALLWLNEYRFDGLRFDAVHAIEPREALAWLADRIRQSCGSRRHVHLMLENECNEARLLGRSFTAQWNDDGHNALHVALTGEAEGYYADFADDPMRRLARVLTEGFAFQGERDRRGRARGEGSTGLPPQTFIFFLQNHDQIGNRALGERLVTLAGEPAMRAATVLAALSPQVPLFFMGDEWGCATPFFYFTDYSGPLGDRVREGRRAEFSAFGGFNALDASTIPDPNARATFARSVPRVEDGERAGVWRQWFAGLLAVRRNHLLPFMADVVATACDIVGDRALVARWSRRDGSRWELAVNLGVAAADWSAPAGLAPVYVEGGNTLKLLGEGRLAAFSAVAYLNSAARP